MTSHQTLSAQRRIAIREVLAGLKGVPAKSLAYPRSNQKLQEYEAEIQQIREEITNAEATRLMQIDPHPHYEITFNQRNQVRVGNEITDSNFIADIAIGTPGEHDYEETLNINRETIKQILQDE